ncbi:hypothetical protein J5N97_001879 [Dioscorea zingiberensis]|uniref:Uncharacterized protein n=1 Tax=Dioscorea zingiberensis TaxID=325984 RepID=A0A9D5BT97_9LILI|nr:hypothetical protein J5N97_001879 [Dioscorea zingiberensis]
MARKWQKVSSLKGKISSPRADECADFSACSTSSVAEKGHFFVYTSEGKRFMVPLAYLDNNIFKELLKISEEEFGLPGDGPITLPCDAVSMEYVLSMLRRGVSQEVERALLSSIFVSCQSSCSMFAVEYVQQLAVKMDKGKRFEMKYMNHSVNDTTEHVDLQQTKMELSNALSTSLDTPLLSKDNTYSMDTASQGNVIGPLLAKPNSSADFFKSSLKISLSSTSSVAEKGHFNVYTSEGRRFMVPLVYLDNNIFKELLRISEEEFGLPCDGPITLPCDAASMEYVLSLVKRGVSKEMEMALLSSIFISSQSTCSVLSVEHNPQQLAVCS